jgi:hypothetical protein
VSKRHTIWLLPLLAVLLLGAQACSRKLDPQDSCNFVQNPDLQRIAWKTEKPVKLYVHKSVPREAYGALQRALGTFYRERLAVTFLKS